MNKLTLVVLLFAVLQATNSSPAKRNWDDTEYRVEPPTQRSSVDPTVSTKEEDKEEEDNYDEDKKEEDLADEVAKEMNDEKESPEYGNEEDVVEGDIKMTPAEAAIFKKSGWDGLVKSEAWMNVRKWPREIPYVISGIARGERIALMRSIAMFHRDTCLRFVRRTNQRDYLQFVSAGGCWSYLGRRGGAQRVSLGRGCSLAIPAHEILHALGRHHEQTRPDRDYYVRINYTNIYRGRFNFNKQSSAKTQGLPYDYASVMHYSAYAFARNRRIPTITPIYHGAKIGSIGQMSTLDIMQINVKYCPEKVVRLVGGRSANEGRVEVLWENKWGTVCGDYFDQRDANVICKFLGYASASSVHKNARYGQGVGPIWFDNMACNGNERSPFECHKSPVGYHNCHHGKDVGVVCQNFTTPPTRPIRLVGGISNSTLAYGRVEVYYNQTWGTVCDDNFGVEEAMVICRQLGFTCVKRARAYHGARYGQGSGQIWLDDLLCTGDERRLMDCRRWRNRPVGSHNCQHSEDASVLCAR